MIHFERDAPFTIQVYWWDVVRSLGHSGTFFRSRNGSVRGHRRLQSAWGQPKVVLTQFRVALKFIRDWASFRQAAAAFVSRKGDIQDKRMRKPKKLRLSKLEPNRYSRTKDIQRSVSLKKAVHPCKKTTFNTGEYGFFTRMQAFWGSHSLFISLIIVSIVLKLAQSYFVGFRWSWKSSFYCQKRLWVNERGTKFCCNVRENVQRL